MHRLIYRQRHPGGVRHQRGLTTLLVVMVLFFVVAMVAAYTSRNLVFEQRASANQYRSTQALEAAEAGMQWALAMLNGGRIDNSCQPVNNLGTSTFRARYIDSIRFDKTFVLPADPLLPRCTLDAATGRWNCICPTTASAALPGVTSATAAAQPFFRVNFRLQSAAREDILAVESVGCTRADASCLPAINPQAPAGDAMAIVTAMVTLRSALSAPPGAPITAAGNIDGGDAALGQGPLTAVNNVPGRPPFAITGGVTFNAGGTVIRNYVADTEPGTPGVLSLTDGDPLLAGLNNVNRLGQTPPRSEHDRLFSIFFGMWPDTYRAQPSVVQIDCSGGCTSADINARVNLFPGHAIWVNGGTAGGLVVNADIGSTPGVADPTTQSLLGSEVTPKGPVLLIVEGNLTLTSGTVYGLVYRRKPPAATSVDWSRGVGTTTIRGALISEGNIAAGGAQTVIYDAALLNRLHTRVGTYVRVPGGWRDF
jgi:type II secretory pathway pseudopilin PulG